MRKKKKNPRQRYITLMHQVSELKGTVKSQKSLIDAISDNNKRILVDLLGDEASIMRYLTSVLPHPKFTLVR